MKLTLLSFCICILISFSSNAQTVSISSNTEVCIGEILSFESITTAAVTSYSWSFGDGASSSQQNPSHIYTIPGTKTVNLNVTFTNGTVVSSSQNILVNDVPKADFSLDGSSFCQNNQNICLTDNSTMGSTSTGYASRIVLWGDGNTTSSTSPSGSRTICYSSYPSPPNNPYTITVEVVNDKGCEVKWQENISILPDFVPSFSGIIGRAQCDEQEVCFTNGMNSMPSTVSSFEWDYGDGTTNTTLWSGGCHKYTASGVYTVKLKVLLTNGCENEFSIVYPINIFKFETNVSINSDTVLCFGQPLRLGNASIGGASYTWELYDADKKFIRVAGNSIFQDVAVPCPGDYYVKLKLKVGNCTKESRFIKFSAVGVMAAFVPLNAKQCVSTDTVYMHNITKSYPNASPSYFWDFGDKQAPDCYGFQSNCNKDSNEFSQHFYLDTGCMTPTLTVIDRATGCTSFAESEVSFVNPDEVKINRKVLLPCLGAQPDYGVLFYHNLCDAEVKICVDSLDDDKTWKGFGRKNYLKVADPDGWVTVGFAIRTGEAKVYRSADINDFYIDSNRMCNDTFWFHNWFQLFPSPVADFVLTVDTVCLPQKYDLEYVGGETDKLVTMLYSWEIQTIDTFDVVDTVPHISHTYYNEGVNMLYAKIIDTTGCHDVFSKQLSVGYANEIKGDSIICLGQEIVLQENIRYYDSPVAYWRDPTAGESVSWDLGDGNGFSSTLPSIYHTYTAKGRYNVRLASKDKNGCVDTTSRVITVGGVNAAIKQADREYLCDQIVQFIDSSYFDFNLNGDIVTNYHWDFGDFSTPSTLKDPFHYYSTNGNFVLTLSVQTRGGCIDTARIPIYLKGPEPSFEILSDTMGCAPFTARFASSSQNTGSFVWRMGDANQTIVSASNDTTFSFTYTQPGTYYIYLEGSDSFVNEQTANTYTCSAIFPDTNAQVFPVRKIVVLPIPQALFYIEDPLCYGDSVIFQNRSDAVYTDLKWDIDGEQYTSASDLGLRIQKEGVFSATLIPSYEVDSTYQRHCFDTFSNTFSIFQVDAQFGYESSGLCSEYIFSDSSLNAVSYSWDFGHPRSRSRNTSDMPNPTHSYGADAGDYKVCLTVTNEQGCEDSACTDITVEYITELSLYNIFTPNGDGTNDFFYFDIENYRTYELLIYNRYGELMFTTKEPTTGWNGTYLNTGEEVPAGTYYYVLKYGYNCQKTDKLAEGIVEVVR